MKRWRPLRAGARRVLTAIQSMPEGVIRCYYPGCKQRFATYLGLFGHQQRDH